MAANNKNSFYFPQLQRVSHGGHLVPWDELHHTRSITEVEEVAGVVVILTLSNRGANGVDGKWQPCES
jgi:predicted ATP-grasp superfamily ATP-dependent carboligase